MPKFIHSVTGAIQPSELGITLCHEHMAMTFDVAFIQPPPDQLDKVDCDFTLENLGWIRQNPFSHRRNLLLEGAAVQNSVVHDIQQFLQCGGKSIVECTTHGLQRKARRLLEYSIKTGVNIIAGTGFYVEASQPTSTLSMSTEDLVRVIKNDICKGTAEEAGVTCGIIGEVGTSYPLTEFERKSLHASAMAQDEVASLYAGIKPPVNVHPGRHHTSPEEAARVFAEAGGDLKRFCISHVERTLVSDESLWAFVEAFPHSYLEFDLFGNELSYYPLNPDIDFPSDAQRIARMKKLIDEKHNERLLISHDIYSRHRLSHFGGHGYQHILENVIPKMKQRGFSQEDITKILVANPAEFLAF